jgi:hypothetical protein
MNTGSRSWPLWAAILSVCASVACGNQGNATNGLATTNAENSSGGASGGGSTGGGTSPGTALASGAGSGANGSTSSSSSSGAVGMSDSSDAGTDSGALPPPTPKMSDTCLMAGSADFSQKGPYTVTKTSVDLASTGELPAGDAGPTTFAIFTPSPLDDNCPHPVVAWGNGTGVTGSSTNVPCGACTGTTTLDCLSGTYDFYNVYAASYGIVVIASDNPDVGSGVYHKAAIDYMMKQNADPTSPFYNKLSTRVGTSGHSQGGIGATAGANLIGANCQAEVCVAGGGTVQKTNAFICLTGTADIAESACSATYQAAPGPSFLADWDGGDHFTTETLAGYVDGQEGTHQFMHLYAAWFRCFLADDQTACKLFNGGTPSGCGICKDPGWAQLASKNL